MRVLYMVAYENKSLEIPVHGPSTLRRLCQSCLNRDPAKRPSTAEILTDLDLIASDELN